MSIEWDPHDKVGKLQGTDRVADNAVLNIHESPSYSACFSASCLLTTSSGATVVRPLVTEPKLPLSFHFLLDSSCRHTMVTHPRWPPVVSKMYKLDDVRQYY